MIDTTSREPSRWSIALLYALGGLISAFLAITLWAYGSGYGNASVVNPTSIDHRGGPLDHPLGALPLVWGIAALVELVAAASCAARPRFARTAVVIAILAGFAVAAVTSSADLGLAPPVFLLLWLLPLVPLGLALAASFGLLRFLPRSLRAGLMVLVLVVVCIEGYLFAIGMPASARNEIQTLAWPHRFSAEAWQQNPERRSRIALDLVQSGELKGKSAEWLRETLGEPLETYSSPSSGVFVWAVPSPQRQHDMLIVNLRKGVVTAAGVNAKGILFRP